MGNGSGVDVGKFLTILDFFDPCEADTGKKEKQTEARLRKKELK
jgi:hypothetical protein